MPLLFLLWSFTSAAAQSGGPNQAGLVIVHGDGTVITRCIAFDEPEITGVTLLQRSGLQWQSSNGPMGSALCSVDGEGCAASDCFCRCKQAPCAYWNYFTGNGDGSWTYSGIGVAVRTLKNGDIDGWVWGDASTGPVALTFETICSGSNPDTPAVTEPPATTSPVPEPTATPTLTPSATPEPTISPVPSLTAFPTATLTQKPASGVQQEPTSTSTPEPTLAPATSTMTMVPDPTLTPQASPSPDLTSTSERFINTPAAQIGAFILLLCALVIIYLLQKRRK